MALISANTIITSLSLFHITLAYFFLASPGAIADQTLVFIIGEAMGLVRGHLHTDEYILTSYFQAIHSFVRESVTPACFPFGGPLGRRHQRLSFCLTSRRNLAVSLGLTRFGISRGL